MSKRFFSELIIALLPFFGYGQGIFVNDQFSSADLSVFPGAGTRIQQFATPFGQSFTPSLSAVDFIHLNLNDFTPGNGLGATLYVVLHSDSMSSSVLGSTTPVSVPDGSATITTFLFPTTVALTANTTYYFEVLVQPIFSDSWNIIIGGYNYAGGSGFAGGLPGAGDLWFQEGIIVPEPSAALLFLLGGGFLFCVRRFKHQRTLFTHPKSPSRARLRS